MASSNSTTIKKRFLAGEPISASQESFLKESFENDAKFRLAVLQNDEIHRLLFVMASKTDLAESENDFVQGVISRISRRSQKPEQKVFDTTTQQQKDQQNVVVRDQVLSGMKGRRKRIQLISLVASAAVILLIVSVYGFSQLLDPNQPDSPSADNHSKHLKNDNQSFAKLIRVVDAKWEKERNPGDRIGSGSFRLSSGTAEFLFDNGTKLTINGPADFSLENGMNVQFDLGNLEAFVPKEGRGFTVKSPNTKVVDLGTKFQMIVDKNGLTEVEVTSGSITAESLSPGTNQKYTLTPKAQNRATFYPKKSNQSDHIISSSTNTSSGKFEGKIAYAGQTKSFESQGIFDKIRKRINDGNSTDPNQTSTDWINYVQSSSSGSNSGQISVNGVTVDFSNLEEAMSLKDRFGGAFSGAAAGGSSSSSSSESFSGSLNINGKVMRFSNKKEYEKARKKLFGSAAKFGAGDF